MERASIVFEEVYKPIEVLAKLDTGNGAKASHIEVGKYELKDGRVSFTLNDKKYVFDMVDTSHARTGGEEHDRPIIRINEISVGLRKVKNVLMALVESREKSSNMLINRDLLAKLGYVISSNETHLLTDEMEKVKIV